MAMDSDERARAEERLVVLELLESAMARRDDVFAIVHTSEDADEAQERIRQTFGVQDPHSSRAVLDIQVSRWSRAERTRLANETSELRRLLRSE
jgi:DNA gyrase/topoisomerase IV subunit A